MEKSAVITTGNKQYHVKVGDLIKVEKITSAKNEIIFDQVLLLIDGENITIGTPLVANTKVYASLVSDIKGEKIQVFRYKSKSRYRKMKGHRQIYSQVRIESIGESLKKPTVPKTPKSSVKKTVVKKTPAKKPIPKKSTPKKSKS